MTGVLLGRGGAGNALPRDKAPPSVKPSDLVTPRIKASTYTTGRGGTGNMAWNDPDHPEISRAAQDVEAPEAAFRNSTSRRVMIGRGGQANVVDERTMGEGGAEAGGEDSLADDPKSDPHFGYMTERDKEGQSWAEWFKELFVRAGLVAKQGRDPSTS